MGKRHGPLTHLLTGVAIVAGAVGVGVVEALRLPRGSIWLVVTVTVILVVLARALPRRF